METYPLTPEGAEDKLAELYALSDTELAVQAMAIALDFKTWVKVNFDLTVSQRTYIDGMNADAVRFFGLQCSAGFLYRIDIELDYPAPPVESSFTKWLTLESTIKMATDGNGSKQLTGSLTFTIDYVS
ncbi:hypothetical protein ACR79P_19725 [Sphingobacterium spiritivorum]|uniref:hypothetical protein n=1 Tax=Sphingobacterium spiritivorum TaxID=258 RepID=UPI003DA450EC